MKMSKTCPSNSREESGREQKTQQLHKETLHCWGVLQGWEISSNRRLEVLVKVGMRSISTSPDCCEGSTMCRRCQNSTQPTGVGAQSVRAAGVAWPCLHPSVTRLPPPPPPPAPEAPSRRVLRSHHQRVQLGGIFQLPGTETFTLLRLGLFLLKSRTGLSAFYFAK